MRIVTPYSSKQEDAIIAPASLTKVMSMYIVSDALKHEQIHADDRVTISKKAWQAEGSRMFLKEGSKVTVRELVNGVIIASGNDATIALAEYIAGSEESFADMMNIAAKNLGMTNTHFVNATGLPTQNIAPPHVI